MQYMGGKTRIAKQIAAEIDKVRKPGQLVWDAFCGGLSVSVALSKKGPVLASDACLPLISLYKAVQEGWDPPTEVSKETWQAAKLLPDTDPMKAFCGFGCSFGGKWFGGYVSNYRSRICKNGPETGVFKQQWPHVACRNGLLKDCRSEKISFKLIDFITTVPKSTDFIIYCDIPYKDTHSYSKVLDFNYDRFYELCAEWSKYCTVFVSEYNFPLGNCIWSKTKKLQLDGKGQTTSRTERLYHIPKQS